MKTGFSILLSILLLLGTAGLAPNPPTGGIVVDAGAVLAPVSPLLFGQNYGPLCSSSEEFVQVYRQAKITLLRFPAGNYGDENDLFPNNLDDLADLAGKLNAQVVVQARSWRDGTPEKAAALVRYANIEKKYHFVYWEVGNEPDLYQNRLKQQGDPVFDVSWYNASFRAMAQAMKAVDPTIKVVGPVVTGGWRAWMPAFLQANGDIVDVLSWHFYGHGSELSPEQALGTAKQIEEQVQQIRAWWADPQVNPLGFKRPVPPLLLSEYNVSWATSVSRDLGSETAALWNAELLGRMANLGVEMGAHFAIEGLGWQGMVDPLKQPRPVFGVYQLFTRWGDTQVRATSPDETLLPAFASRAKDGTLSVMVLNKDPSQPRRLTVTVQGAQPVGKATVYYQDETHQPGPAVEVPVQGSSIDYEFPPYSVTLLVIPVKPAGPTLPFILAAAAVLLGGVLVWVLRRRGVPSERQVPQAKKEAGDEDQ